MRWADHVTRLGRGDERTGFWLGNVRERDHLEDPDVVGTILLKCSFKYWDEGMNMIDLAQKWGNLRALVKPVKNLLVP